MTSFSEEEKLRNLVKSRKLEPFISHIRFPQYKNLAANTKIEFTYPITALVGANGTNKSSILRALYGSPGYNNLGNFWFSTTIDPIEETGERPSFIYGYWNTMAGKVVEILKTRIKKDEDPDYWEPSRPIANYGMEKMPKLVVGHPIPEGRRKTRWSTIKKNVVYLDFRATLSAFDKFFYHGELRSKPNTEKNKKDLVRARASHLKRALDDGLTTFKFFTKERIVGQENRILSTKEVEKISTILGRQYEEIRFIRHTLFNCDAYSCLMRVADLRYSEAFAGSGEFAVVRIVTSVLSAADKSLILLDEPEVSLHPGAQDRLLNFLSDCVKHNKHQVVISTHSPAIVRKLPPDAIKVLFMDAASGKVILPRQSALPEEAFFYLGEPIPGRITLIVEDVLAEAIVKRALLQLGEAFAKMFDIIFFPGGSQTLWSYYLPIYAAEGRNRLFVLFDGDKRPNEILPDPATISSADENKLKDIIRTVAGTDIDFHPDGGDGGGDVEQLNIMRRKFVSWAREYVDYLPGVANPEQFIWEHMAQDAISNQITDDDPKKRFEKLTRRELGIPDYESVKSSDIFVIQRTRLTSINETHSAFTELKEKLESFATKAGFV